jgi:hypothetical protein
VNSCFRWLVVPVLALSLIWAPPALAQDLSPAKFQTAFIESLQAKAPDAVITIEEGVIRVRGPGDFEKQIMLDQAYRRYRDGEDLTAVIDSIVTMALMPMPGAFREDMAFILVRPTSYLDPFLAAEDGRLKPFYRPLAADLLLIMAQDHGHSFSYPPESNVTEVIPDLDALWERTTDRTIEAFGEITLQELGRGVFLLTAREDIAASLVIDPAVWEVPKVAGIGDGLAVAVFRDALVIADADNPAAVTALRELLASMADSASLLSDQLIVRRGGRWSALKR